MTHPGHSQIEMQYMHSQINMANDVRRIATSLEKIAVLLEDESPVTFDDFSFVGEPELLPARCINCGCTAGQHDGTGKLRCVRCGSIPWTPPTDPESDPARRV